MARCLRRSGRARIRLWILGGTPAACAHLFDFLLREPAKNDDASASDYLNDWPLAGRDVKTEDRLANGALDRDERRLWGLKRRLDKQLAHITWSRVENPALVGWDTLAVPTTEAVLRVFSRFNEAL